MRIVKEFMDQDSVEKESKSRKRDELRKEMLEYKTYLEQMRAYERKREEELDNMYRNEEDRIWNVRNEKWKKEQAARDKLMSDVLEGRKEQIKFAGWFTTCANTLKPNGTDCISRKLDVIWRLSRSL